MSDTVNEDMKERFFREVKDPAILAIANNYDATILKKNKNGGENDMSQVETQDEDPQACEDCSIRKTANLLALNPPKQDVVRLLESSLSSLRVQAVALECHAYDANTLESMCVEYFLNIEQIIACCKELEDRIDDVVEDLKRQMEGIGDTKPQPRMAVGIFLKDK